MRQPSIGIGALIGGITSLPVIALFYLGSTLARLPFAPFDLFEWLVRRLPGNAVTIGIDTMVSTISALNLGPTDTVAKVIEQIMALLLFSGIGIIFGALLALVLRHRSPAGWRTGTIAGGVMLVLLLVIEADLGRLTGNPVIRTLWLGLVLVGWGALLGYLLDSRPLRRPAPATAPPDAEPLSRRAVLLRIVGGSLGLALGLWGLGRLFQPAAGQSDAGVPLASVQPDRTGDIPGPQPAQTVTVPQREHQPVPGTRPEVTPNDDFYRIDINAMPPVIDSQDWTLSVAGLFDRPRTLRLNDVLAFPAVTQPITLSCISNQIGGDLIGTSYWTGVRLGTLMEDLELRPEARELFIEAADGFYESVSMADMMDPRTLLVYGMNGKTLPHEHGFPLRIYIPNRYGMKQPKWITRIEAIDHEGEGYWVERGWSEEARPNIVSVIDTVAQEAAGEGLLPIGGIAWAGDRGIQKVEIQVDDGNWVEATRITPPIGPLTWVLWRHEWPMQSGRHTFRVRATDGTGQLQVAQESDPHPSGATGYHEVSVSI